MVGAFGIFLMRQFMVAVPNELLEAAEIDCCGEIRRFVTIVIPLVQPALITLTIFTFNAAWNNFLWPLIINTRSEMRVLPVTMSTLASNSTTNYGMVMAGATLTFLFPFVLYIFLQKQFVEGIALGGVKGEKRSPFLKSRRKTALSVEIWEAVCNRFLTCCKKIRFV